MSNNVSKAIIEGSLEVKLPTIWTDEKQRWEESEKRREEERRSQKRKSQKKEDPGARKGRKVAKHCVFPMICGSGGSKSRLTKAAGAEPAGQMRDEQLHVVVARSTFPSQNVKKHRFGALFEVELSKKCTRLWREAHLQVKKLKSPHVRSTFGSWDDEKVHAVVAQSTFPSQNVQSTPCPGPLLEVDMLKKCTPLWREAHFEVKSVKNWGVRDTFGRSDVVLRGRRKGLAPCQKWAKREGFVAFPKTMAGVGHLKRIWKDAFRVAGAVQETCSSEMLGGPGADFLRRVAFWAIRSVGLLRWFCVTGAALRMTWHHFFVAGAVL